MTIKSSSMTMDDMILVSVDDHVCEPPDMWDTAFTRQMEGQSAQTDPAKRCGPLAV